MIIHRPHGIDDPYKRLPTERFPRDPLPDESVQVGFEAPAGAQSAWVAVRHAGKSRCCEARSHGKGLWTAELGSFSSGECRYTIHALLGEREEVSEEFRFDVGLWSEVTGIGAIEDSAESVIFPLITSGSPAQLSLSFPIDGVCRAELLIGKEGCSTPSGLPCNISSEGSLARLIAGDTEVLVDSERLTIAAHSRSRAGSGFSGSLRFRWLSDSDDRVTRVEAAFHSEPGEWLYGLGERFTHPNRRGHDWDVRVYEEYQEQEKRTYLPVPFLVSTSGYGLWLDCQEPSYFDLSEAECRLTREQLPSESALLPLSIFVGHPYEITSSFTLLTGEIQVPPKWAFGPWMSANTWNSQAKAEAVVRRTLEEKVPATVLVLEAWSDESTFYIFNDAEYLPKADGQPFKLDDFSFGGRWPDPKSLIDYCHENGIRVVLWQIPVQKKLEGPHRQHDLDEAHMLDKGYCILEEDGSPYRNKGWWFTDGLVVDFTNPEAKEWWFSKRRYLFDELGIDGMKTDGGEHLWGRNLRSFDGRRGLELFNSYPNLYVEAYHDFIRKATGGDGVTFSRAGYTGAQQWPCHWAGDESSTWKAYRASIQAGLSAGLSGVSMWAWDIAGFSGEIPSAELYLRATAMATFCPLMQYHSEPHEATECRDRTPWNIAERHRDPTVLDAYRQFARLRMELLDYIYGEAQHLSAEGLPLMRYPALEFPLLHDFLAADPYAYLLGRDLLVAPVVEKGVLMRDVRLPPGEWLDFWSAARFEGEKVISVPAPLDRIPVFVRGDSPRARQLLAASKSLSSYGDETA